MHMHGWRGQVETKRASERPYRNLTPAVTGSQEFVLGGLGLRAGDDNVVVGVGFAVRAEGAEGIAVRLAFVLIWSVPGIDTDHAQ